ncbi:MAG: nucleotidyltransferase domain-containing protein [Desulfurococcaceae archaeon]|nr:nucleotidyltransferase domain-containing protein [Desulfurococcaceae archaeon]
MLEKLQKIVEALDRYRVRLVILFRSMARGNYTDENDIDILIVADDTPNDPREAYQITRETTELIDPRIQPIALKTESSLKKLEKENTFITEILEDEKLCTPINNS